MLFECVSIYKYKLLKKFITVCHVFFPRRPIIFDRFQYNSCDCNKSILTQFVCNLSRKHREIKQIRLNTQLGSLATLITSLGKHKCAFFKQMISNLLNIYTSNFFVFQMEMLLISLKKRTSNLRTFQ